MRKTSVYLTDQQAAKLAADAAAEGRSQADVIRAALSEYVPVSANAEFELAAGFDRIDTDPRPISEIPEHELLAGFGE